jgi:hypothetical protein
MRAIQRTDATGGYRAWLEMQTIMATIVTTGQTDFRHELSQLIYTQCASEMGRIT